ncbi:diacylglycerol kinase family protein [Arthrobacter sp. H5]|uniref:diacylglycerol/lipid kinase family protein n=1 Tax=Arthrobacter sp. H5 TaxID=1267973 RepID=UPI000489BED0|nr:diacylglycerol kinase family protein [Arthrobacter sp. H5]
MTPFDRVVLIYNPAHAGIPPHLASMLDRDIAERLPGLQVEHHPTEFAGHARELARVLAANGRPLLVSVSGDGGYHEVVNGLMEAGPTDAVCAVMAAGNANDHRRSTGRLPVIDAIERADVHRIDLLRLTIGGSRTVYAHSYVGFGLTPRMAIAIEEGTKGTLTELLSIGRSLSALKPFEISRADGAHALFDSLVFANISHMAKYGKVSESAHPDDGLFEVITLPHAGKWRIALMTFRAVTIGLGDQPSVSRYAFTTTDPIPCQADGEVIMVQANTSILVESVPRALAVIS